MKVKLTNSLTKLLRMARWCSLFFTFFASQQLTDWYILRVTYVRGGLFSDLGWVLNRADCFSEVGWKIYGSTGDCGWYIYGSNLIRFINFLGLDETNTKTIGWMFIFVFSVALASIFSSIEINSVYFFVFAAVSVMSPSIMLLLERGNFDILVFVLLSIFASLLSFKWIYSAIGALIAASLFKFYPAPLLIWMTIIQKKTSMKVATAGIFLVVATQVLVDLNRVEYSFPRPTFVAFGNPIFGLYIQYFRPYAPGLIQDLLGLVMLGCAIWVTQFLSQNGFLVLPDTRILTKPGNARDAYFSVFSLIFLFVYFAGSSYDYRLVYLIVPAIIYISRIHNHRRSFTILVVLLIAASWLSGNFIFRPYDLKITFQPIGDLAILGFTAVFVRGLYLEIKSYSLPINLRFQR